LLLFWYNFSLHFACLDLPYDVILREHFQLKLGLFFLLRSSRCKRVVLTTKPPLLSPCSTTPPCPQFLSMFPSLCVTFPNMLFLSSPQSPSWTSFLYFHIQDLLWNLTHLSIPSPSIFVTLFSKVLSLN
jgi:hypothetical protein